MAGVALAWLVTWIKVVLAGGKRTVSFLSFFLPSSFRLLSTT